MIDRDKIKEGEYFYAKHRNMWGVWRKDDDNDLSKCDVFISDFSTQVQAKNFVYRMNGWTLKDNQ